MAEKRGHAERIQRGLPGEGRYERTQGEMARRRGLIRRMAENREGREEQAEGKEGREELAEKRETTEKREQRSWRTEKRGQRRWRVLGGRGQSRKDEEAIQTGM